MLLIATFAAAATAAAAAGFGLGGCIAVPELEGDGLLVVAATAVTAGRLLLPFATAAAANAVGTVPTECAGGQDWCHNQVISICHTNITLLQICRIPCPLLAGNHRPLLTISPQSRHIMLNRLTLTCLATSGAAGFGALRLRGCG